MRREVLTSLRILAFGGTLLAGTAALAAQESEPDGAKSPGTAQALSSVGAAAPIALSLSSNDAVGYTLLFGGLVLGPALGYVYAGDARRGLAHAGVRAAILGGTLGAALLIRDPDDDKKRAGLIVPLVLGGALATTVLAVLDINRVGDRVRARNQVLRPAYFLESRSGGVVVTWRH